MFKELQLGDRASITLIVQYRMPPDDSINSSSDVMEEDRRQLGFKFNQGCMERVFLHITFPCVCVAQFSRLRLKRKSERKEIEKFPFLASTLVFAFSFAFAFALRLFTRLFICTCACVCVDRVNRQ